MDNTHNPPRRAPRAENRGSMPPIEASRPPQRVQRSRKRGSSTPPGTIYVGRPTPWGNPFPVQEYLAAAGGSERLARCLAVEAFKRWVADRSNQSDERRWILDHVHELRGKTLSCWCPINSPCHADVLLDLANP